MTQATRSTWPLLAGTIMLVRGVRWLARSVSGRRSNRVASEDGQTASPDDLPLDEQLEDQNELLLVAPRERVLASVCKASFTACLRA